jgi:hypothetical protein
LSLIEFVVVFFLPPGVYRLSIRHLETSEGKKGKSNRMRAAAAIRYRPTIDNGSNIAKCHINLAIAIHNCGRSSGGIEYRCCRPHTFSRFLLNLPWRLNFNSCFDSTWLAHFLYTLTPRFFFDGMKRAAPRLFAIVKTHRARLFSFFFFFSATTTAENSREKWRTDRQKKEKMNCVERDSSRRGASSPSLIIGPQPLGEEENKKGKKKK